jgi:hypothetical protein
MGASSEDCGLPLGLALAQATEVNETMRRGIVLMIIKAL